METGCSCLPTNITQVFAKGAVGATHELLLLFSD